MDLRRRIVHADLDTFFVSVERLRDPSLEGRPVIVGGDPNGRGVVTACSYETRVFGVRSGMPARTAARLCPQAIFIQGRHGDYRTFGRRVNDLRSEEHTSELQSRGHLVCRLLLEKKKQQ